MGFLRGSVEKINPELDTVLAGTLRRVYSETICAEYEKRIPKISSKVSRRLATLGGLPVALVLGTGEGKGWHLISTQHLLRVDGGATLALKDIVSVDVKTLNGHYLVFSLTNNYMPDRYTDNSLHHVGFSTLDQAKRFRDILDSERARASYRPVARTVPTLLPNYFNGILQSVGKPTNAQNGSATVELVAVLLSSVAKSWFRRNCPSVETRWSELFGGGGDPERVLNIVDDMVDFLLSWQPTCEPAVDRCLGEIYAHLIDPSSQLRKFPGDLPFGMAYNELDWISRHSAS